MKTLILTKKIKTRLVTDLSLHFIPELCGFKRISHIAIIYAQCIVCKLFSRHLLKATYSIFVSSSSFPKRFLYAAQVFSLVFYSVRQREGILLSTFSNQSFSKIAKIAFQIVAAILFLLV